MYELALKEKPEKVALKLPLFYRDEPALSVNLSDVHSLTGLLVRTHATLCLLHYTNDPKLTDIHDIVKSEGILSNDVIKSVASLYPLDLVSLTDGSPFKLEIVSYKGIAEAIEILLRLPYKLLGDHLDHKKKKHEFKQQQKEDEKKNTFLQLSPEEIERISMGAAPKELIDIVMRGDADRAMDMYKVLMAHEQYTQEMAKTTRQIASALGEIYKLPGFQEASSRLPQTISTVYNIELMRDSIINQTSDLHFYEGSFNISEKK